MRQSPRLSDCLVALCQCLVGKAETKEDDPQSRLCCQLWMDSGLTHERAMGVRIIKREHRFEVRSGRRKPADLHQVSTGGVVTHNEPGGIVASTAQMQQVLGHRLRPIQLAAMRVIAGLPAGTPEGTPRGNRAAPTTPARGRGPARLRRGRAFDDIQHRAQSAGKFELAVAGVRGSSGNSASWSSPF